MEEKRIKLNLGSGDKPLETYQNLDGKQGDSLFPIVSNAADRPWDEPDAGTVDEIRASHVLEHFPHGRTQEILNYWVSKLKPGGVLKVAVPNFEEIASRYLAARRSCQDGGAPFEPIQAEAYIMGGQTNERDYHKALFDEPSLRTMMTAAGLVDIGPWISEIQDCASLPISLNLQGRKPDPPERKPKQVAPASSLQPPTLPLKLAAVMSVPRLSITNNVASMYRAIRELGITCKPAQGVFWHHVLTRQIEDRIADGFEYLLAVDFDSWFLPGHVLRLAELLVNTPQADAICAVQCQREAELPIMAIHDESGLPVAQMPRSWFARPLTPIHIGHFGLTLFRASCFARLSRPWFRDEPDPNGSWREGRKDADVAFWGNFERSGCKLFLANEVNIGHLQEVCTFPGPLESNWGARHVYLRDLNAGQIPAHCDPAYRILNPDPQRKE